MTSGTLLGAVRENKFIAHDDDVDFAIILKSCPGDGFKEEILFLEGFLRDKGFIRGPEIYNHPRLHWKLKYLSGTNMDLFPCWIEENKVHIWPYSSGVIDKNQLFPIGFEYINGVGLAAPNDSQAFLVENYGAEWIMPNKFFKFNWEAAKIKFPVYVSVMSQLKDQKDTHE